MGRGDRETSGVGDGEIDDSVFYALRNRRRRFALYFLLEHESVSLAELADVVTGWIRTGEYGMATRAERDGVYASLVHRHVPVLEEADLVEWSDDRETVSRTNWPVSVSELVRLALTAETGEDES